MGEKSAKAAPGKALADTFTPKPCLPLIRRIAVLIFCLLSLLLPNCAVFAQPAIGARRLDSLLKMPAVREDTNSVIMLSAVADEYQRIDPAIGIAYGNKALAVANTIGWRKGAQLAYTALGDNYLQRDEYASAIAACLRALPIAGERKDYAAVSRLLGMAGMAHMVQFQLFGRALDYEFKSLRVARYSHDPACIALAQANIAEVYVNAGNRPEALKYGGRALALAETLQDPVLLTRIYGDMGVIYANLNQKNAELAYYFKALRLAKATGNQLAIVRNTGNIGGAYQSLSGPHDAHPDTLVSASYAENRRRSIAYLRQAAPLAIRIHAYRRAQIYLGGLATGLIYLGDYRGAVYILVKERELKHIVATAALNQNVSRLETERALQLKDKDIRIEQLAAANKRNERVFYIAGIALLLVILGMLIFSFRRHERARRRIKELQDHKISMLDHAVRERTEQLSRMRQTVATDFHDQTGNMLAAINRQAAMLEMELHDNARLLPLVQSITTNSNQLYASSKDFLWNLNNNSDNPLTLFQYLTAYGQDFSNQFDISFSAHIAGDQQGAEQLSPFAALNLIYIFKEAMSNVIKHSGADEVTMTMTFEQGRVVYTLADNGRWKEATTGTTHYGLDNMQRRCQQAGFGYELRHDEGTCIAVSLPLTTYYIQHTAS